jgi:ligand-binding sensor domain-containing protein/two-component sensor histidine kinase
MCSFRLIMVKSVAILLLLQAYIYNVCNAQNDNVRCLNFGSKEGLTDNFAYAATQDHQGYMWFATPSGLYRFDGHAFKIFRSPIDKPGRAISNILQTVYTAKDGTLWLGGFNTLQWYNPLKNRFWSPDYTKPTEKNLGDAYLLNFTEDEQQNMWIATSKDYFYKFNNSDSSFIAYRYLFPKTATKNTIKVIVTATEVWAIHQEGLYSFSKKEAYLGFYPIAKNDISNGMYDATKNSIILTTYASGLVTFNVEEKKTTIGNNNASLVNNNLFCVAKSDTSIWVGSYPLFKIDSKTNSLITIQSKKDSEYDLKAFKIGSIFIDREKNVWVCGYTGLSMISWQNNQIRTISLTDKISGNTIEPTGINFAKGGNDFFISNTASVGLIHYSINNGIVTTIKNNFGKAITSIVQTVDSSLYASDGIHFLKVFLDKQKLIPYTLIDQNKQPIANVGRNVFDSKGSVYIAAINNGFYIWNTKKNQLTHYNKWDWDTNTLTKTDNTMLPCLVDREDNVWFTSNAGVYKLNTAQGKMYHVAYTQHNNVPLLTTTNYMAQDKQGHYWICTNNNGLYELYFDNGKEILKNYTQSAISGLPSDFITRIKQDKKDSTFWISYNTGLLKFNPITKKVVTILKKQNGLVADAAGYAINISNDNKLIQLHFGNMNIIDLNEYKYNTIAPQVILNSVKVFDVEKIYNLNANKPQLDLTYAENFIQIEFASLLFNNSNQTQFAYKLEGADKEWIYSGNRNTVSYSGLSSGQYIFKVKACNNDGVWSNNELMLIININPPFYKTWWFVAIIIIAVLLSIFCYNKMRIAQVKKEEKLKTSFKQQIAETEMKALRAQMNPHFIFNSLNSIQKYILQKDNFTASQYLTKFSRLIRLILDHSNEKNIALNSEIELLNLYMEMESLRFENKFSYDIQIDTSINTNNIKIPSMLIQPYVENAIWHGLLHKEHKGNLLIAVTKNSNTNLIITIQDDGIGRDKAAELKSKQILKKKSYGMQIGRDRISIINQTQNTNATCIVQDSKDENGIVNGTIVTLTLPTKSLND